MRADCGFTPSAINSRSSDAPSEYLEAEADFEMKECPSETLASKSRNRWPRLPSASRYAINSSNQAEIRQMYFARLTSPPKSPNSPKYARNIRLGVAPRDAQVPDAADPRGLQTLQAGCKELALRRTRHSLRAKQPRIVACRTFLPRYSKEALPVRGLGSDSSKPRFP